MSVKAVPLRSKCLLPAPEHIPPGHSSVITTVTAVWEHRPFSLHFTCLDTPYINQLMAHQQCDKLLYKIMNSQPEFIKISIRIAFSYTIVISVQNSKSTSALQHNDIIEGVPQDTLKTTKRKETSSTMQSPQASQDM